MAQVIEFVKNAIAWGIANKEMLLQLWAYVIAIATIIVKILPVLPENSPLLPFVKFIGKFLALNKNVTPADRAAVATPVVK